MVERVNLQFEPINASVVKKIALVIPFVRQGGGAEKVCAWLSLQLAAQHRDVHLITFVAREQEHHVGGKRHVLGEVYQGGVFGLYNNAQKIKKICAEEGISTVLAFTEEANAACILAKVLGGTFSLIVAVRNNPEFRGFLSKLFIRMLYSKADRVVANSLELTKILQERFGLKKVHTIPNPSDIEGNVQKSMEALPTDFLDSVGQKHLFFNIGRLIDQKGHIHLIRAFKEATEGRDDCMLAIAGHGIAEEQLKNVVKEYGIQHKILFLGRVENVYPYLKRADCFVLSSLYEGFPNVLLEALSLDTLVISTDCRTGPREILGAPLGVKLEYPFFSSFGILTAPFVGSKRDMHKAEKVLARLLEEVIAQDFWRGRYIQGHERVSQFKPEEIFREWDVLLQSVAI